MLTAKEARQQTNKYNDKVNAQQVENQLNAINTLVIDASTKGKDTVYVTGSLLATTINKLKELGYTVKYDPGDDRSMSPEDRTYISW